MNLDRRVHRNQDTAALGKMAFVILKTFLSRIEKFGFIDFKKETRKELIQYVRDLGEFKEEIFSISGHERPPMITVPEYIEKFHETEEKC
ncbi:MAG: hypothetical protein K9J85_03785 [Desulfobacteraceae bacterium]|nr:hypothetical protein [Desulfobacteraceae bacterium]